MDFGAAKPVDFRKGQDGLAVSVQSLVAEDRFTATVFVFRGIRLVLACKRLKADRFTSPAIRDGAVTDVVPDNWTVTEALFLVSADLHHEGDRRCRDESSTLQVQV